jgi:aldehyde:ferredoxin oxidoreductase
MASPKGGLHGRILDVDLTGGAFKPREIDDALARKYLGGTGLATYFMYTEIPAGIDPLSPENLLIFACGPLNGTECPGSRMSMNFKSPINGHFGNSFVGGAFPSELKWAGWDMIVFRGASPKPVYLSVRDDKVELRDAAALWGKDTHTSEEMLKEELADPDLKAMVIGPAGENKVAVASIISERFKSAGRGGGGAVMGNKNLKAVAVHGTKSVPVADPDVFHKFAQEALELAAKNDRNPGFRLYGTAISLDQNNYVTGTLATRNYQTTWYPDISRLGGEEAARTFWQRHVACVGCQVHCMKFGVIRDSEKFEGLVAEGPEYESGVMEGSNVGISEFDEMIHLIEKCDAMGLDNIGAGNVISFTLELLQRGILTPADLDGIDAKFGDVDSISRLFDALAYRKGKAGELLALGVYGMAQKVGKGSERYAVMTKRQGWAAHDPRGNPAQIYTYALGPRGGVHTDGNSAQQILDRALHSSMCLCYFVPGTWRERQISIVVDMLNSLCGWNFTPEEFQTAGKRILTLQRAYSIREGKVSRKDDTVPPRMFEEKLPDGPKKGGVITEEMMKKAQDTYYALVGWDADGIPTEESMKKYGLDFAMKDIKK